MLLKTYQQGYKLKKVFLCVCFCVTLWDSWCEADEAYAKLNMIEKARNDLKATVKSDPKYTQVVRDLWKKFWKEEVIFRRDFCLGLAWNLH